MIAHVWSHSTHNRCEAGSPVCGARVAWRLKLREACFPEFYCAVCAPLVARSLGITDPSRAATLREGQPSEVLQVHAFASEGDLLTTGQNGFDQETSEAADVTSISGLKTGSSLQGVADMGESTNADAEVKHEQL